MVELFKTPENFFVYSIIWHLLKSTDIELVF